jgi:hypothetical protein
MLNSGFFFFILTLVLTENKFLNETKNHNPPPPLQVKWSVPYNVCLQQVDQRCKFCYKNAWKWYITIHQIIYIPYSRTSSLLGKDGVIL